MYRHLVLGLCAMLIAACSAGEPPLSGKVVTARCLDTRLPVETRVSLFGVYRGEPGPNERPPAFRESRPARVRVETADNMGPEVLILSAYEPVIWDVSAVAKNDLRGVVAYGYHRPEVTGVPGDVPVRLIALRDNGNGDGNSGTLVIPNENAEKDTAREDSWRHCGEPAWVYHRGAEMQKLAEEVKSGIGLPITGMILTHSASSLSLDRPPLPSAKDMDEAAANCDETPENCFLIDHPAVPADPGQPSEAPPMRTKWRDDPWSKGG